MNYSYLPSVLACVLFCFGFAPQENTERAARTNALTETDETKSRKTSAEVLMPIDPAAHDNLFSIVNGDVEVNDKRIADIRLTGITTDISKLKAAKIMLLNRDKRSWRPDFTIRILNKYGVALGHGVVFWKLDTLAPNERYQESVGLRTLSFSELFEYSSVQPGSDFNHPVFIAIEYPEDDNEQ